MKVLKLNEFSKISKTGNFMVIYSSFSNISKSTVVSKINKKRKKVIGQKRKMRSPTFRLAR